MVDTPSSVLLLRLQATGSNTNLWGGYLNTAMQMIEQASKGYQTQALTADTTISWTNYSTGNIGAAALLKFTGTLSSAVTVTMPAYQNFILVWNAAGAAVTVKVSGGTGVAVPNGRKSLLFCDGVDYYSAVPSWNTDTITLTNNGDIVTKSTMETAIAAASGLTAPFILVSAADTTAGYYAAKTTSAMSGLTTTQVAGLTSLQLSVQNSGGNEKLLFTAGSGYVGGYLNGGTQSAVFIPVVGTEYNCDCSSAGFTVNLSGMTTPQPLQSIKINKFGAFPLFLLGTVNGATNLSVPTTEPFELKYASASWGWN